MIVLVDYASPSVFDSDRDEATLGLAVNRRRPVRFAGQVKQHGFVLRIALRALGAAIWSDDTWFATSDILDPVITVHPDRIFFEAFSQDQSVYACLIVHPDLFEAQGEVATGTTNIDFTAWLWGALGEMRTSRRTMFRIGAEGLEVTTADAGGRFERKVDLPDTWVRGFLQVQAAMAMPGTRLNVKPIDLLSALRFLRHTKAKVSPRALRYEFEPGQDARVVLEPWEHVVPLEGAEHNYTETKTTRVWGRRRLKLIEGLLPFAEGVTIYLKGRALPSFYAVHLPGMTFVLGMTGLSGAGFTSSGGFDLLADAARADDPLLEPALQVAAPEHYHVSIAEVAERLKVDAPTAASVLVRLCRQGRAMFDVEARRYRHRELFEQPADEATYFPPDRRRELAAGFIREGRAKIDSCLSEETTKTRSLKTPEGKVTRLVTYRDWRVAGVVDRLAAEIVINDTGQVIFGRCACPHFQEHLLNQGPCEHMLALFQISEPLRIDSATSTAAQGGAAAARKEPSRDEVDSGSDEEEATAEDSEEDDA